MKTDRTNAQRQARWREKQKQAIAALQALKGIPGPPALSTVPGRVRWVALLEQARSALEVVRSEMESYIDDRSETWQESDRAAELQARLDQVADALSAVEEIEL